MALVYTTAGEVAAAIQARIQTITTDNGFETNIGANLFRGRRKIPADDELPASVLIEGDDQPGQRVGNTPQYAIEQVYVIDGFDVCEANNPNDKAHAMLRDMKKAIFGGEPNLGGCVRSLGYVGRDIGPRPDGYAAVQARIIIEVEYAENLAKP